MKTPSTGHPEVASCSRSCSDRAPRSRPTCNARSGLRRRGQVDGLAGDTRRARVRTDSSPRVFTVARITSRRESRSAASADERPRMCTSFSHRARLELNQGQWEDAAKFAEFVLGKRLVSTFPRSLALVSLALVRARRGDPDVWALLDEARDLFGAHRRALANCPVAAASGEAAWLSGRSADVAPETDAAFELALSRPGAVGARRARRHSPACRNRGRPSEAASRAAHTPRSRDGGARSRDHVGASSTIHTRRRSRSPGETEAPNDGHSRISSLGARPAAQIVARRLRESGLRRVPVGPRTSTRTNPSGLTARELRSPGADGRGVAERGDRRAAVPLPPHRGSPRFRRAAQARREHEQKGSRPGADGKACSSPGSATRKTRRSYPMCPRRGTPHVHVRRHREELGADVRRGATRCMGGARGRQAAR